MSTQFTNRQWRLPNNKNKDKQSNYSMDFDGSSQYIDLGNTDAVKLGTGDFTFSAWINPDSWGSSFEAIYANAGTNGVFIGKDDAGNFVLRIYFVSNIITYSTLPTVGAWTHICVTRDNGQCSLFYNGSSVATATSTHNFNASANVFVGSDNSSGDFNGKIDAVAIYNYALTDGTGGTVNQIAALYGSSSTGIGNPMSLSPKPVAYYPLGDQDAFNGADYLVPNSSLKDYVFDFDGGNDYIDCGNDSSLNISGDLTISAWVKINNYDSYNAVISKIDSSTRNYEILIRPSVPTGGISFYVANSTFITSTGTVPLNTWTHIVVSVESGVTNGAKIYINGSQDSTTGTLTINSNTVNLNIGRRTTNAFYIDGKMSNAQIFNSALPATGSNSVETLYNNGSPLTSMSGFTSLQGWWKLDASATYNSSTTTWTIPDDSTNSNDGTSSGMTQSNLVQSDLSFTSGYSPYALDFDGTNDYIDSNNIPSQLNTVTASVWVKRNGSQPLSAGVFGIRNTTGGSTFGVCWDIAFLTTTNKIEFRIGDTTYHTVTQDSIMPDNTWTHVVGVADGANIFLYINGVKQLDADTYTTPIESPTNEISFGRQGTAANYFKGSLSNACYFNTGLSQSEITEIYNEGVPSNLNNHSAYSNLVSWWQLGSNSSFNTNWTVLDEKGSNNGTSVNMTEADIVDGVGSYANGLGTSGLEVVGSAPFSDANSLSVNMDVEDRVTGISNATITTGGTGYVTGTNIATTGGTGSGCTVDITASGGAITAVTINNSGSGYSVGEVLTVVQSGGSSGTITVTSLNTPS